MDAIKLIEVYEINGRYLSSCSSKRAEQMVARQKAQWIDRHKVELLITNQEEKRIRKAVLIRDGYICYICDKKLASNEVTYDHLIPRKQGGTDYEDNLYICCRSCNEDKADMNPEQYTFYLYTKILVIFKRLYL